MIIVAFDQAVKGTGFAYGSPGTIPSRGWQEFPDYGDNTARLGKYVRDWSIQFMKSVGGERVYFEQVIVRKFGLHMPTLFKQMTVSCTIEIAAEMIGLQDDCYQVLISDWRTEFYAGLRPPKNSDSESAVWKDMALKECARRNWFTDNHNAAEACGIWDYGCKVSDKAYRLRSRVGKRRQQSEHDAARAAA